MEDLSRKHEQGFLQLSWIGYLKKNEDRNAVITIELIDYIYKEKVILLVARYQPILKSAELNKSMRYLSNRQHSLSISL